MSTDTAIRWTFFVDLGILFILGIMLFWGEGLKLR